MQGLRIGPANGHAEELAALINAAYDIGEGGLWAEGKERITPAQVADIISREGMLRAELDGRLVGCARVFRIDDTTAELGLVAVAPEQWGNGVGGELVIAAEERARALGADTMELRVLTPTDAAHAQKQLLSAWYEKFGYRVVRSEPFDAADLIRPCEFRWFQKPLR